MHELIIRGGTVVDGTGAPAVTADIAIDDGVITEVGRVTDGAREEIDADGLVVTPGYVDVHTHYDAQATWDPTLTPSSWHGVTTMVLGNCGVGFAPVRPSRREWLVELMEAVEDIPAAALNAGIPWGWESFPEYLDVLASTPRSVDIGTQVPHGALRAYVMDERGTSEEEPTADELARMAALVEEAMNAGALGVSTNRLPAHRSRDGKPVPGTFATEPELWALGRAMAAAGGGVLEIVSAGSMGATEGGFAHDIDWSTRLALDTGVAVTLCLSQVNGDPDGWRDVLRRVEGSRAAGVDLVPQIAGRPLGMLLGLQSKHQFQGRPSYDEIAHLPLAERARAMADPERRRSILTEESTIAGVGRFASAMANKAFPLGEVPDYEPPAEASVAAIAGREGRDTEEVYYDLYCQGEGTQLVLFCFGGYANDDAEHIRTMLLHPSTVLGLADGGAHCALICDASVYTSMLSHFVRDRTRGERVPLELAVHKMSGAPAALYGLRDRGVIEPGRKADLNLIDLPRLALRMPRTVHDFPTGAPRLVQEADGYVATLVSGQVTLSEGADTGARPGALVRRNPA